MIDELKQSTKKMFGSTADLVSEYLDKHKKPEEYFFVKFDPKPTISSYEMMKVFMLNNTLWSMYNIMLTPLNEVFMSAQIYYSLDPDLIRDHFIFLGSQTCELTQAYDRINNSVN